MKIIFFGSSDFVVQVLEKLHETDKVVAVVSTPDAPLGRKQILTPTPVSVRAQELGLSLLTPPSLKSAQVITELKDLEADLYIVASYGKIIPPAILALPQFGVLNIHPSLLPAYRGPTPIQTALAEGQKNTGVTIIKMDAEVDHGPIAAQTAVDILPQEDFQELAVRLFSIGAKLLIDTLEHIEKGELKLEEQDDNNATFTKILQKIDGKVDWKISAKEIHNKFRAYHSWPGIWTTWRGEIIKILDCSPLPLENNTGKVGTILQNGTVVCANNSGLQLKIIQLSGKQPTDIQSFLHGHPDFPSVTLE